MPTREFFENLPLYTWMLFPRAYPRLAGLPRPDLRLNCPRCESEQSYSMANDYRDGVRTHNASTQGAILQAVFRCTGCGRNEHHFFLRMSDDFRSAMKVGQFPQPTFACDPLLESALGAHADLYRQGLVCESAGQGIGAFWYYRRLADGIMLPLLDEIRHLVDEFRLDTFDAALARLRESSSPVDETETLKGILPTTLRPKRMDLLALLCEELQIGDPRASDKSCLTRATRARHMLVFLLKQVEKARHDADSIASDLGQILSTTLLDGPSPSEASTLAEPVIA
jgi:hypothetical protein